MFETGHGTAHDPSAPDGARRSALARLGALGLLSGMAALGIGVDALAAAPVRDRTRTAPALLTRAELALTGALAGLIIPRTDTPGALDVGAHRTIDHLLAVCALAPAQAAFKAGLARIDAGAQAQGGKRFVALGAARRLALLQALDSGAAPFDGADQAFFRQLKAQVAFAYYTSEAGAVRELAYLPVPGGFKGDIAVTPATHAWAI